MQDPIADMLTRIRNASMAKHTETICPFSKFKLMILKVLKEQGCIDGFQADEDARTIKIMLRYTEGQPAFIRLERKSRPGLRCYVSKSQISLVKNGQGFGIISTPKGVITSHQAWKLGLGGEYLCIVE